MKKPKKVIFFFIVSYFLLFVIYSFFSYSLTDPNLIFFNNETFIKFQTFMWTTFYNNLDLLSKVYLILIILLFSHYLLILKLLKNSQLKKSTRYLLPILFCLPLIFANNALSHDVFNYIFNAKMLLIYKANPHIKTALDFADDDWLRFMHNVHTPAPYGYGWTIISIIPYISGFNKFILIYYSFRFFSLFSFILYLIIINRLRSSLKIADQSTYFALALNPLILIELVANSHNDFWMLIPALLAILLVIKKNKLYFVKIILSIILIIISVSTKFASVVLIPIITYLITANYQLLQKGKFYQIYTWLKNYWPELAAILMFLPLMTERSKFFLPWYLSWSLAFLPLCRSKLLLRFLLSFSIGSMLRYYPSLTTYSIDQNIIFRQIGISFGLSLLIFIIWETMIFLRKKRQHV